MGPELEFDPTDWRSQGYNSQPLVYKASGLSTTVAPNYSLILVYHFFAKSQQGLFSGKILRY